jgi:NAD(P)H-flavin reductase
MRDGYDARVVARRKEADNLTHLELDVTGTPLEGSHLHPGQYVRLGLDGVGEGLFALASGPHRGRNRFELLVKDGPPLANALARLQKGDRLRVSLPQGKGFPLGAAHGKNVLLVATGSGISPIRSALEVISSDRASYGAVTLYFGARTPGAFPYAGELAAWEKNGIRVCRVVSQPHGSGWTGLTGYVQAHLPAVAEDTVAFLSGQKAMVQAVTELLVKQGLPRARVFLNF